jgi:hypothetical protein
VTGPNHRLHAVRAAVVLRAGRTMTTAELIAHVTQRKGSAQAPKAVHLCPPCR